MALEATKEFIALAENQTGRKIKCFQSDNSLEFVGKDFNNFLRNKGITRRLTIPYNPEQNGVAERRNRTLLDMARCLLAESGLPSKFCAEAVNTANYIRNRCPSKSLNGLTPYQMWTGKVPDVEHLKKFGTRVLCLNRKPDRGKLDRRCKEGIFLGYSTESKGLRIWIPEENKVIVSRDVKFIENTLSVSENLSSADTSQNRLLVERTDGDREFVDINLVEPIEESPIEDLEEELAVQNVNEEDSPMQSQTSSRGRGRPRILRTGRRGKPRQIYTHAAEHTGYVDGETVALITEIPMRQALSGPEADEWQDAMMSEIKSVLRNGTWELIDRPKNSACIGSRIVLRNKFNSDGTLHKRKIGCSRF